MDNESSLASGWRNSPLSEEGIKQGLTDCDRYKEQKVDAIFASDLDRAISTAKLIFGESNLPLYIDWRLREYNYGDLEGKDKKEVMGTLISHYEVPFPNGESVKDALARMESFIKDLEKRFDNKTVIIIGHRATQLGLEHFINGVDPKEYISTPWTWQPGWNYKIG